MTPVEQQHGVFDRGPPARLERRLHITHPARHRGALRRAGAVLLIGWAPLAVLAAVHGTVGGPGLPVFLTDIAAQARALAAPMLVLAQGIAAPQLSGIVAHFEHTALIDARDQPRFAAAASSTRRLLESLVAEVGIIVLAYLTVALVFAWAAPESHAPWARALLDDELTWTPAGYWNALVTIPLLLILLYGWIWRFALWTRFLHRIARLDLHLVASHPDRAAGLAFMGQSIRAFIPVAMAVSLIVAGSIARQLSQQQISTATIGFIVAGVAVAQLLVACGPLLSFIAPLLRARRQGIFTYGALARRAGLTFEARWLDDRRQEEGLRTLDAPDFSATTDLYQIVDNVYAVRPLPVDGEDLLMLLVASLLPFLPVALMAMPVSALLARVAQLLL